MPRILFSSMVLVAIGLVSPLRHSAGEDNSARRPIGKVTVRVFEGVAEGMWEPAGDQPDLEFQSSAMALVDLPHKYNSRGVIDDRRLPLLVQLESTRHLAEGVYCWLLRTKNAGRLYLDDELVAETPSLDVNGDGHELVPDLVAPLYPGLRPLPQGHHEQSAQVSLAAGVHRVRVDLIVGGSKLRPECGDVCAAFGAAQGPLSVLTPDGLDPVPLTEPDWLALAARERERLAVLNRERRDEAGANERAYWDRRHALACDLLGGSPPSAADAARIDKLVAAKANAFLPDVPLVDDQAFLRRVTLDTIGLVPTRDEVEAFEVDTSPDKRWRVIDRLLDDPRWADHWVSYWQDVLAENPGIVKPEQNNTGPFRWWIYESFLDNKPLDRWVTELVMMEGSKYYGGPAGFGVASQNDAPLAAKAQILGQAFLGLNMACARCHDAPRHPFLQAELFQLAAMLNRQPLALPKSSTVPPSPSGREPLITVSLRPGDLLQPVWDVTSLPAAPLPDGLLRDPADPRERLAVLITSPTSTRFAQVVVNRLWKRYLGWGLVEPVDDWNDAEIVGPELLEFLARELVVGDYDLKHVARLILNSRVYQARPLNRHELAESRRSGLPAGPARRQLTAEQLVDSLFEVTGKEMDVELMTLDPEGRRPPEQFLNLGTPQRSWHFASTSTDRDRPALIMPATQQVSDVLIAFGWRDARPNPLTERDETAGPLPALILANGLAATRLSRLSDDAVITQLALEEQPLIDFVDAVYRQILSRAPAAEERAAAIALLEPGYEARHIAPPSAPPTTASLKRNAVSWANHLRPEATRIKLAWEQEVLTGDVPTARLDAAWRERCEDMLWAMLNSPEFVFVP